MQEVIVKYNGDVMALGYDTEILNENYAIIVLPDEDIPRLTDHIEIEYVEIPPTLSLSITEAADSSCIPIVHNERGFGLKGEGVLTAFIDSGIDYRHPDFINPDGSTRLAYIWDQTIDEGNRPSGFLHGAEYTREDINQALISPDPLLIVPHQDFIGHGTAVAGLAAGNGRSSDGLEVGVAPMSSIIAVKLGDQGDANFARATEIMRGIKYIYDKARLLNMPVSINISYGTNDGSHDGMSLFESYLNDMAIQGKSVISVASGNEGAARHHFRYGLRQGETVDVSFSINTQLSELSLWLWKSFADDFTVEVIAPDATSTGQFRLNSIPALAHLGGAKLKTTYVRPNHYNRNNAISFTITKDDINRGVWTIKVTGTHIVDGVFDVWLPTLEQVSSETSFLSPSPDITLTIPSCAEKVITVGGYDSRTGAFASFSGRGFTRFIVQIKPDIVAPAVNVRSCKTGGGYGQYTGTSMAAPFVTGCAALMMEWGIVLGHDPFLFGQRVKAFLIKGAARDNNMSYPNSTWGYGKLCLSNSMDILKEYEGLV